MPATQDQDNERFESGAPAYAAYLETPEGRLRSDLGFANLEEFLPQSATGNPLRALDVGCGTGETGIRLARLGFQVTLVDFSRSMLDLARRAAEQAGVKEKVDLRSADARQIASLFPSASFDVIVCHNVLEFLDEPGDMLLAMSRALRDSPAILSVLVRNRAGEVFKAALLRGDLEAAEMNLNAEWGQESLYGGPVRLFTADDLQALLRGASLDPCAVRGVRALADYLPQQISRRAEYARIFSLERKLCARPEYIAISRYVQCLARRSHGLGAKRS